jgi:hypothetical protein
MEPQPEIGLLTGEKFYYFAGANLSRLLSRRYGKIGSDAPVLETGLDLLLEGARLYASGYGQDHIVRKITALMKFDQIFPAQAFKKIFTAQDGLPIRMGGKSLA